MGRKGDARLCQFVADLVEIGTRELTADLGIEEPSARVVMRAIAHSICLQYARTTMYVPADLQFDLGRRDIELWEAYQRDADGNRRFTPERAAALAQEYRITTSQVYTIFRMMRKRERDAREADMLKRQGLLPGVDPVDGDNPT